MKLTYLSVILVSLSLFAAACGSDQESFSSKSEKKFKEFLGSSSVFLGSCELSDLGVCTNSYYSGGKSLDVNSYIETSHASCEEQGGVFTMGSNCSRSDLVAACHFHFAVDRVKFSSEVLLRPRADLSHGQKVCTTLKGNFLKK